MALLHDAKQIRDHISGIYERSNPDNSLYQYGQHEAQPEVFSSVFESLWWAVATLTTVGYGDAYPITVGGKIFTFVILMIGLGIIAVPAGVISSSLSKARDEIEREERERKKQRKSKKPQ